MKKVLSFVLAIGLVIGMIMPAYAVATESLGSDTARQEDLIPFLVDASSAAYEIKSAEEIEDLPEESQENFQAAKETLEDTIPEGMAVRYFFYFVTDTPCTATFRIEDFGQEDIGQDSARRIVFIQFVDKKWTKLESVMNEDGTITALNVQDGPMAVLIQNDSVPFLIEASSETYEIKSGVDIDDLPERSRESFYAAKEVLADAAPKGMTMRNFFYFATSKPCSAVFLIEDFSEIAFRQFADRKWIELEFTINKDRTITVLNVVDAPLVIYTK